MTQKAKFEFTHLISLTFWAGMKCHRTGVPSPLPLDPSHCPHLTPRPFLSSTPVRLLSPPLNSSPWAIPRVHRRWICRANALRVWRIPLGPLRASKCLDCRARCRERIPAVRMSTFQLCHGSQLLRRRKTSQLGLPKHRPGWGLEGPG